MVSRQEEIWEELGDHLPEILYKHPLDSASMSKVPSDPRNP